jgi:hypothetical protein
VYRPGIVLNIGAMVQRSILAIPFSFLFSEFEGVGETLELNLSVIRISFESVGGHAAPVNSDYGLPGAPHISPARTFCSLPQSPYFAAQDPLPA